MVSLPAPYPPDGSPTTLAFWALGVVLLCALTLFGANRVQRWARWRRQSSLQTLKAMTWREFEFLTADTFRKLGYGVRQRGGRRADGGVDLLISRDSKRYTVQCKHWTRGEVGVMVVREAVGVALHEGANGAYIVTVQGFTKAARAFAQGKPVHLVDGVKLLEMIAQGRDRPTEGAAARPAEPAQAQSNPPAAAASKRPPKRPRIPYWRWKQLQGKRPRRPPGGG